ncbi:ester cyclase [Acidisphaera sp. S103]|uniref:ester cyclase n=1 Tax=Acidisphaera sp. S103 TaxID=1747223 RepID=UPI00131BCDAC|nr:ester cyclase [Acidisphaera sp. S103]
MDRRHLLAGAALAGTVLTASARAADDSTLIDRFAATLSAHDMAGFAALFAEDYVNHQTSAAVPPPPAGKTPKQLSVAFFAARLAGIPDLRVTVETALAADGKVAASFVYTGTHGGLYFGIAPTGRKLRFTSCDIFRVTNNQFAEHWGMGDIAGVLAQLRA